MAVEAYPMELKLVRAADSLEVDFLPLQGLWTVRQYLRLTDQTNHLIEFSDGALEILPRPTKQHQAILLFLYRALFAWMERIGGDVYVAPLRLRVRKTRFREPDLLLVRDANDPRSRNRFWLGADLVLEVVSPKYVKLDTVVKRAEYAGAGIPEYWIVNPLDDTISVLTLVGEAYIEHGVFRRGETATSVLLADFTIDVTAALEAGGRHG